MRLKTIFGIMVLMATPLAANAQLTLTFTQPDQTVRPGDTLTFSGTLLNNGSTEIFLNGSTYTLGSADFTLDPSPFLTNAPTSLLANQSYSGDLFTLTVAPTLSLGTVRNTFTITGGNASLDQNNLVTTEFRVSAVPEPDRTAFLAGLILVSITLRHRKRILKR